MSSSTVTRKRSRANLQEPDELALEEDAAPLSSTKKRKLNTYGSSSAHKNESGKRTSGGPRGLFGRGKHRKENLSDEDDKDELANDSADDEDHNGTSKKDIWDVDDSEPEEATSVRRRASERWKPGATPKSAKAGREQTGSAKSKLDGVMADDTEDEDIWDVPESPESSQRQPGRSVTSTPERVKALPVPAAEPSLQKRSSGLGLGRGRGRPRKSDYLRQAKLLSRKAIREVLLAAGEADIGEESERDEGDTAAMPSRQPMSREEMVKQDTEEPGLRSAVVSTGKKRGRPSKAMLEERNRIAQSAKSILTPVKQRAVGARKSVAFDAGAELDLGFKDLPTSVNSSKTKSSKKPPLAFQSRDLSVEAGGSDYEAEADYAMEDAEEDGYEIAEPADEDEEMCAICSGLRSTNKNPIILCDGAGCDFAVHRECYQLPKVPDGDFFCRDCDPEAEDMGLPAGLVKDSPKKTNRKLPRIDGVEQHLRRWQRVVLDRLTGQKRIKLRGHDDELQKVHQVLEQTVLAGEGNSMLVIGARGCGKTTLVESVISDLSKDHRDDFHVVRLNGFIHTDDKLALKETWRQLGREMETEDEVAGKPTNYSDTLASLLALLSHPSEISEAEPETTAKSVIFILDEFDLFTTHPRQTLLYNLFDIAQARKAPIVVLGLTTRVDVVESLEKRVKSRFSHRYVHLSLPRSLPAFWDICRGGLCTETNEIDDEILGPGDAGQEEFASFWQAMIEDLYNKDTVFKHHVQSEFYRTKSVSAFFTSCIMPIANLSPESLPLTGNLFTNILSAPDSKLQMLQGLSELELALLIAAARLDIILDTDTCNFAMAYDEYSSLTSRYKIQTSSSGVAALGASAKVWGRDVALEAWERLAEYGILVPAGIGGRDFGAGGHMWRVDVGLEEIPGSVDGLSGVMAKWCREI